MAIAHSDYKLSGIDISRTALIEFVLIDTTENCSFSKECGFESGACDWRLETGVQIVSSGTSGNTGKPGGSSTYPRFSSFHRLSNL